MTDATRKNTIGPAGSRSEAARPLPEASRFGLRGAMLAVAAAAVLARLGVAVGPAVALLLLAVLVLSAIAGGIALAVRGGRVRSEPMLWVVANAVERGLPLEPGIEACGDLCGGAMRFRARAVVRLLERGAPPGEAFALVRGSFPGAGLVFLRMGWDGPRLGAALRDLIRRRAEGQPFRSTMALRLTYMAWTVVVMQLVVAFMSLWIMPKIELILMDFGVAPPAITRWTLSVGQYAAEFPLLPAALGLQVLALPLLGFLFVDPTNWGFAPIDWLIMKRHGATVLRALSGEVALGRPMPEALDRVARAHPSRLVRRRLRRARAWVERGQSWTRGLARGGLIRAADAVVLDAAGRVGNLPWVLGDLADGLDRRAGLRLAAWSQVLFPVAMLVVALPVFVVAVGYFIPLVAIIRAMTE